MKESYLKPVIIPAKNEKPLILPRRVSAEKIAYIPKRNWIPIYISLVFYFTIFIGCALALDSLNLILIIWEFKWIWLGVFLPTLLVFIIPFFKISRAEKLRGPLFILDRQAGTFSYTDNAQQEHIYDFKHIKIREGANPMLYYTKEKPVFIHKPFWRSFSKDYRQAWSFCVWYMDKNRPLPPDRIFYPYRDADFERRKAEGFPPPLYKSQISTREATPEQHAEREQYWKDKDYLEKQPTVML